MPSPSERDSYRLAMLGHLERENREAETQIAQLEAQNAQRREKIKRLQMPYPKGDICVECWLERGRHSVLHGNVQSDDPSRFDRYKCDACGYYEDRPA